MKKKLLSLLLALTMVFTTVSPAMAAEKSSEQIGSVVISVEASTIGMGYIIDPVRVPLYKGDTTGDVFDRLMKDYGFSYEHTGRIGESSFYLSSIADGGELDTAGCQTEGAEINAPYDITGKIPAPLQNVMNQKGLSVAPSIYGEDGDKTVPILGEFCYSPMSGWMYAENNVMPGVGMGGYTAKSGDVIRIQFTLFGYGADIGGNMGTGTEPGADVTPGYYPVANKDALVTALADFNGRSDKNAYLRDSKVKAAYKKAVETATTNLDATEAEVTSAISNLQTAVKNAVQTISASSKTVAVNAKDFTLKAKSSMGGKLSFASSNSRVAKISRTTGKVAIKGIGETIITIKADPVGAIKAAYKRVKLTVTPKKAVLSKVKSPKKKTVSLSWKKDKAVTGYQVVVSKTKSFKKLAAKKVFKKKAVSATIKGLKKGTNYVKIRSYKKVGKKTIYGSFSSAKKVKVK